MHQVWSQLVAKELSTNLSADDFQSILDKVELGILFVFPDGTIGPSYSKRAAEILGTETLEGSLFVQFFDYDPIFQKSLSQYLNEVFHNHFMDDKMFHKTNPARSLHFMNQSSKDHKSISLDFVRFYKTVAQDIVSKVMITITDNTAETNLKQELVALRKQKEEQRETLFEILRLKRDSFQTFVKESSESVARIILEGKNLADSNLRDAIQLLRLKRDLYAIQRGADFHGLSTIVSLCRALQESVDQVGLSETESKADFQRVARQLQDSLNEIVAIHDRVTEIGFYEVRPIAESPSESPLESSLSHDARSAIAKVNLSSEIQFHFSMDRFSATEQALFVLLKHPLAELIRTSIRASASALNEVSAKTTKHHIYVKIHRTPGATIVNFDDSGYLTLKDQQSLKDSLESELQGLSPRISMNSEPGLYTKVMIHIPRSGENR